ncbi:unnamed protein product [Paramecium sonneborni]|uniref:Uncharacterized protein n=1 Tax=Paramecium sonneborni TaxID=65129 RepID=A0A8S1RNR8_9CILI|nr:unnamed protein product [Paramecium sonneborni]
MLQKQSNKYPPTQKRVLSFQFGVHIPTFFQFLLDFPNHQSLTSRILQRNSLYYLRLQWIHSKNLSVIKKRVADFILIYEQHESLNLNQVCLKTPCLNDCL